MRSKQFNKCFVDKNTSSCTYLDFVSQSFRGVDAVRVYIYKEKEMENKLALVIPMILERVGGS